MFAVGSLFDIRKFSFRDVSGNTATIKFSEWQPPNAPLVICEAAFIIGCNLFMHIQRSIKMTHSFLLLHILSLITYKFLADIIIQTICFSLHSMKWRLLLRRAFYLTRGCYQRLSSYLPFLLFSTLFHPKWLASEKQHSSFSTAEKHGICTKCCIILNCSTGGTDRKLQRKCRWGLFELLEEELFCSRDSKGIAGCPCSDRIQCSFHHSVNKHK